MFQRMLKLVKLLFRTAAALVLNTIRSLCRPYQRIATTLIASGITTFLISIVVNSTEIIATLLAFVGLGLILWGILFQFAKPSTIAAAELANSVLVSSLMIVDRVISDFDYRKGVYIPSEYIKNFAGGVMLLPKQSRSGSLEQILQARAFPNKDKAYIVPPPGIELVDLLEKQLHVDLSEKDFDFLRNRLAEILVDLKMVENLNIDIKGNTIHARIVGSVYSHVCIELRKRQARICTYVGCTLCSALAYALAKVIKKPIVIERNEISSDNGIIEVWYKIIEEDSK